MRGVEAILGALLVTSGGLVPFLQSPQEAAYASGVEGEVTFQEANVTGSLTLQTDAGMLRAVGPLEAKEDIEHAVLRVYRYNLTHVEHDGPYLEASAGYYVESDVTRSTLSNAEIKIRGNENGTLLAWPNASEDGSHFSVDMDVADAEALFASANGARYATFDGRLAHKLDGPVFGVGSEEHEDDLADYAAMEIGTVRAQGGFDVVLDEASLSVAEGNGKQTVYELGVDEEKGVSPVIEQHTYAQLSFPDGEASFAPAEDTVSHFLAKRPQWTLNGSLDLDAATGQLSYRNESRELTNRSLAMAGNLSLDLRASGEHDRMEAISETGGDLRQYNETLPPPEIRGDVWGEAQGASVDGEPLAVANEGPPAPDISLIGQVLGVLLLVWSVAKKIGTVAVPLLNRDPLTHDRRKRIHDFLDKTEMAHLRQIQRALGIPIGSLTHHLDVLEDEGLVVSVRRAGHRVFFLAEDTDSRDELERVALLADPTRRSVAELLRERGSLSQKELSEAVGVTQGTISRHLSKLHEAGLVQIVENGPNAYGPTQLLRRWLSGT